jgi:hypothetical protein
MSNEPFEREKVCYEQNFEQFRSLNEQMNRVPTIAVTLTGGLWFGAAVTQNMDLMIRFALLVFAGLANVALGLSCRATPRRSGPSTRPPSRRVVRQGPPWAGSETTA